MSTITFDTHAFIKRLTSAGASPELAEAVAEAQKQALSETLDAHLATKADIAHVDKRLAVVEAELTAIKWMVGSVGIGVLLLIIKSFLP